MAEQKGTDGNDAINGGNENDLLIGGAGDDEITGGQGDDKIIGDGESEASGGGAGGEGVVGSPFYGGTQTTMIQNDDGSYTRMHLFQSDRIAGDDGTDDEHIDLTNLSTTSHDGDTYDSAVLRFYSGSGREFTMSSTGGEVLNFTSEDGEVYYFNGGTVRNTVGSGEFAGGAHYTDWADGLDGTQDGQIDVDLLMDNHADYGIYKFLDNGAPVSDIDRFDGTYMGVAREDGSYVAMSENFSAMKAWDEVGGARDFVIELNDVVADPRITAYRDAWVFESSSDQDFEVGSISKDTVLVEYEDGRTFQVQTSSLPSADQMQADGSLEGYWDGDQTIDVDGIEHNLGSTYQIYEIFSGSGQDFEITYGSENATATHQDYLVKFADGRIYAKTDGNGNAFDVKDSSGTDGRINIDDIEDAPTTLWHKFVDSTGQDFDITPLSGQQYLVAREDGTEYIINSFSLGEYASADSNHDAQTIDIEWISNNLSDNDAREIYQITAPDAAGTGLGEGGPNSNPTYNDTIDGGEGNDTILGGQGDDYIQGGDGDDTIYGDNEPSDPNPVEFNGDPIVFWEVRPQTTLESSSTDVTFDVVSGPIIHDVENNDVDNFWYVNSQTKDNIKIEGSEATGAARGGDVFLADGSQVDMSSVFNLTTVFAVEDNGETKFYATFGNEVGANYNSGATAWDDILESGSSPSQIVMTSDNTPAGPVENLVDGAEVSSGSADFYFINSNDEPHALDLEWLSSHVEDQATQQAFTLDEDENSTFNDFIDGGAGDDTVDGGKGDDTIMGGDGHDTIEGGDGSDVIYGDNVADPLPDTSGFTGDPIVMWEVNPQTTIDGSTTDVTFDVVSGPVIHDVENTIAGNRWYANNSSSNLEIDGVETSGATRGGDVFLDNGIQVEIGTTYSLTAVFAVEVDGETKYYATFGNQTGSSYDASTTAWDEILASGASPSKIVMTPSNSGNYPPSNLVDGTLTESGAPSFYFVNAYDEPDALKLSAPGDPGNDTITGGDGADEIYGGAGDDAIEVGDGDIASGGDDRDTFTIDTAQVGDDSGAVTIDGGTDTSSGDEADDYDVLDLSGVKIVSGTLNQTLDADGNSTSGTVDVTDGTETLTVKFNEIEAIVPCFTTNTMIDTQYGKVRAADIKVGDMLRTHDHGLQPVLWKGSRIFTGAQIKAQPKLRPVCIKAGALAEGVPENDLIVSPQHRILVRSKIANRMFGDAEILVAAKKLVMLDGVDYLENMNAVEYIHFLCPQHEIVFSDGAPTETLYTGREALKALSISAQEEIFTIFPELEAMDADALPIPARQILSGCKTRNFVMRHVQNNRCIFEL